MYIYGLTQLYIYIDYIYVCVCVCVSNLMSLTVVILFKTSLHVSGVPCPSSGDTILPGQLLVMVNESVRYGVR
jgi:hypothetical protein